MSAFLNDTWSLGRATINAGVRWDRYKGWLPEQEQLAGSLAAWAPRFPSLAASSRRRLSPRRPTSRGTSPRRASA